MVIELLSRIEAKGISLLKEGESLRFEAPKGSLNDAIISDVKKHKNELLRLLSIDNEAPFKALTNPCSEVPNFFSLSPMQQAYWVGEKNFFQQSCKAYYYNEYRISGLNISKLESALNNIIETHDALRMAVDDNGQQKIVPFHPQRIEVIDLSNFSVAQGQQRLEQYRYNIENSLPSLNTGRPYLFTVHRFSDYDLFSFTFRLIAVDAVSFNLLIRELISAYRSDVQQKSAKKTVDVKATTESVNRLSYYDYIKFLEIRKDTPVYRQAFNYWHERISSLPAAPQLPYWEYDNKKSIGLQAFKRARGRLDRSLWQNLRSKAQQRGLTVNSVLCCIFSDVLARWSTSPDFTLNVLVSDRPSYIPGVESLVGNCSTTILLQVHQRAGNFVSRAQKIRQQLYLDIEHSAVAGVELIRLLQKQLVTGEQPTMPVVFTSGIDIPGAASDFTIHESDWSLNHTHLKTPQVRLDHQVYEDDGELVYNWDYIPEVFPEELIPTMFEYYEAYLRELASSEKYWEVGLGVFPLPQNQLMRRDLFNNINAPLPRKKLHEGFVEMAQQWPNRSALITADQTLSYGQLFIKAQTLAVAIKQHVLNLSHVEADSNQVIGVCCKKGVDQIAAVMGILMAGHTYLPIDVKTPPARVSYIAGHSGAVAIITDDIGCNAIDESIASLNIPVNELPDSNDTCFEWESNVDPSKSLQEERAYIIYTSGSTGNPKGVVINHQAAMNTIEDMVRRFGLTPEDRVFGLSALNFDLSVYDIFATLSNGAALVLPPETEVPDPGAWVTILQKNQITVWNSVPALMEMTLEYLRREATDVLASVRLVLLSGDWIAPTLAQQLLQWSAITVVALGGATEASIWSNYYDLKAIPDGWISVPYGVPLTNQSMFVLDESMQDCPDWVIGDLYIGGKGLADEYLNDVKKTETSFIFHPQTQQRLYRTGDLARIRDGFIEFIGRRDFQVKVRGFRVELGEIEAQLTSIEYIEKAVVIMVGEGSNQQQLVGFYVSNSTDDDLDTEIKRHLVDTLPHYMVPRVLLSLEAIPLSSNGKIDRKKLLSLFAKQGKNEHSEANAPVLPKTKIEKELFSLWKHLLPETQFGVSDNFFEIGGNSLIAVRLTNDIEDQFGIKLPLSVFFQHSSVIELAHELEKLSVDSKNVASLNIEDQGNSSLVLLAPSQGSKTLFLIHPVGGNVVCYRSLATHLKGFQCYGIQTPTSRDVGDLQQDLQIMADYYSNLIQQQLSNERDVPVYLGGWSMGAVLSILVAEKLKLAGYAVAPLLLIDPWVSDDTGLSDYSETTAIQGFFTDLIGTKELLDYPVRHQQACGEEETTGDYLSRCLNYIQHLELPTALLKGIDKQQLLSLFSTYYNNAQLLRNKSVPVLSGDYFLVRTSAEQGDFFPGLVPLACNNIDRQKILAHISHWEVMQPTHLVPIIEDWVKILATMPHNQPRQ